MKHSNYLQNTTECTNCAINELYKALDASPDHKIVQKNCTKNIVTHPKALQKSETLFYAGEKLSHIYAIRSGSIKTFSISKDGEEQITGFHQAGELLGIDALARKKHHSFAKALETTEICAISYEKLDELASQVPALHSQLMNVMSKEIAKQYDLMMTLNQRSADQRLASFLLNFANNPLSTQQNEFNLNMTRGEIGNHLGLALETVSRLFSKFKKRNLIELQCKKVKLLDVAELKELAGYEDEDEDEDEDKSLAMVA